MSGRKQHLVLQPRDIRLFAALSQLRVVDRELAKAVAGFYSTSSANERLLRLTKAGFLRRFFIGSVRAGLKAVYALSGAGAAAAHVSHARIKRKSGEAVAADLFIAHQLLVNTVVAVVHFLPIPLPGARCRSWRFFAEAPVPGVPLIPDAYFELDTPAGIRPAFLEVDRGTEPLRVWQKKVADYLRLATSGEFARVFQQSQFRVLVVASSERRARNIAEIVAKSTDRIFFFASFDVLSREKFWSPVWFRPTGTLNQLPI